MSLGGRVAIAVAMVLGAVGFALSGIAFGDEVPHGPLPFYGLAAFCTVVALACLVPRTRPITLRIIGAAVSIMAGVSVYDDLQNENYRRALVVFCAVCLPTGYLAITGVYKWGRWARAFDGAEAEKAAPRRDNPLT